MCIKYAGDKEALLRLRELAECSGISEDTCETVESYLDMPEFLEHGDGMEEGGKINMTDSVPKAAGRRAAGGKRRRKRRRCFSDKENFQACGSRRVPGGDCKAAVCAGGKSSSDTGVERNGKEE